jgi:hypothetical protein
MSGSDKTPRVVVGVDGSAGSLAALQFAFNEAKRRALGLLVVTAFDLPDVWSITYGLPVACTEDEIRHNVLENTRRVVTETLDDQLNAHGAPRLTWRPGAVARHTCWCPPRPVARCSWWAAGDWAVSVGCCSAR